MTLALIDVPRCLKVHTAYVGVPREQRGSAVDRSTTWAGALPWTGPAAFREQAVRECLDTLAVLRSYREPLEGETWRTPAKSERRLLAQLNAIVALGPPALQQVIALSLDADVPDPGRVFAGLLVLGCVEERNWLPATRDLFVAAAVRGPLEAAAAVEALSLSPNREISALLSSLFSDERPRVRAGVTRALAFRGALTESDWATAMRDPEPSVVAAALTAPLGSYDRAGCERTLQPVMIGSDSEAMVRLALRAGLSLNLETAHHVATQISRRDPAFADALQLLAMFGDLGDIGLIREAVAGRHSDQGVRAAAVLGATDLVPDLLELLDRGELEPGAGDLAKQALATMTGLTFGAVADVSQALTLWSQHSSRFARHVRYRDGQPLTLDILLKSLQAGPAPRSIRQNIYLEMQAATEARVPHFSPYDFVGVQVDSLRRIEQWLADPRHQRTTATIQR